MSGHDMVSVVVVVLGTAVPLAKLWLRLRYRRDGERERRRFLLTAAMLPGGSQVREQREDGTQFTVTVGDTSIRRIEP